jgi:hypothetical protein
MPRHLKTEMEPQLSVYGKGKLKAMPLTDHLASRREQWIKAICTGSPPVSPVCPAGTTGTLILSLNPFGCS